MQSFALDGYMQNDNIKFVNMYLLLNKLADIVTILQSEKATRIRRSEKNGLQKIKLVRQRFRPRENEKIK